MINILITGGAGFLASSLAEKLLEKEDYFLVLVDNLLTGDSRKIPVHPRCKFIRCDVNNYKDIVAVMTSYRFDYVYHYAAVVGVARTLENPVSVLRDIEGIRNILDLCKNTGVSRVFYTSSSEVYGEPVSLPQNEQTTPLNSRLPYAVVKNIGEAFCRSYKQEYRLDFTIFRFFNTYGPRQSVDFVMSKFLRAALKGETIPIYGRGNQTRTFCYVDDNVESIVNAMEKNLFINDVVNIGNMEEVTILHLAQLIVSIVGSSSQIEFLPPLKEGDMSRRQPDITKMKQLLDRDFTKLEEGIKKVYSSDLFKRLNNTEYVSFK
jgi:nucleoside-diphosphate-sugar epimerase